ncbi:fucose-1-phosphate guanylyltransferase-like [Amphiura filiformis]|uniref:fucose-1-phosphate guanylyltransferase-like n=1 Tax=Amphiura filiformis TaxID=82378 RepID=UPI003B227BBF
MASISELIAEATLSKLRSYDNIRGKTPTFPFWDLVVLSAADDDQRVAFQMQIDEKIKRKELPLNVNYLTFADPGTAKIGGGGSLMDILTELTRMYGEKLLRMKVLIIPAGGYSQRLPSASLLGKIFTALPLGHPMYDLLDAKLASLIDFPARMDCGVFLSCADTVELYHCQDQNWQFPSVGITAQGHPSPIKIGTTHGVFLMSSQQKECIPQFEVVQCLQFLHKKSEEELQQNGACLHPTFADVHGVESEMVLTDSGYFMDFTTANKLIDFYQSEAPLQCEIDCHGDFLQPLGPQATSDYITNTSNVCKETSDLTQMRLKVFNLLKGTPLNVLLQSHSQFFHLGTTSEYIDHLCGKSELAVGLGFKSNTFNKCSTSTVNKGYPSQQKQVACVMHSILPGQFDWSHRCIVEYCHIQGSVIIQDNCIISNCCIDQQANVPYTIPPNSYLHTACVKGHSKYVTFVFDVRDNMKQSASPGDAGKLVWLGQTFEGIFGDNLPKACDQIFPNVEDGTYSLWHAKLFRPAQSLEKAFDEAMMLLNSVHDGEVTVNFQGCLSMADILKQKDVAAMIEYRRVLYETIND